MIKVNICCDSNESRCNSTADDSEAEKENFNTPNARVAPLAVTQSDQRVGRDYQKQSKKWWTEHKDFVNRLKSENEESAATLAV